MVQLCEYFVYPRNVNLNKVPCTFEGKGSAYLVGVKGTLPNGTYLR